MSDPLLTPIWVRIGPHEALMKIVQKLSKGRLSKKRFAFELEPLPPKDSIVLFNGGRLSTPGSLLSEDFRFHRDLHRLTVFWDTEVTTATPNRTTV